MQAAAIYLREVRKSRGLTQEALADLVGVAKRTIERLERNEGSITADTFQMVVAVLQASTEHVNYLVTSASATADEAIRLAHEALRDKSGDQISAFVDEIRAKGKGDELLALIHRIENDPSLWDRWMGYGHGLADQKEAENP